MLIILGAETVAHIRENGRLTILFHAFEGPPRIVRLYGKGQSILGTPPHILLMVGTGFFYELGSPEYEALITPENRLAGSRAVIGMDITKVGTVSDPYHLTILDHVHQLNLYCP